VHGAKRSDESTRPRLSLGVGGDAEFEPAKIQSGALTTRFTVKSDEVELKGSFKVDIVGGDDDALKQRIVRYRPLLLAILKTRAAQRTARADRAPGGQLPEARERSQDIVGLDGDDGFLGTFAGNTFVMCAARHDRVSLFAWNELDGSPKLLYDVGEHRVLTIAPSPDGARVAVILGAARRPGGGVPDEGAARGSRHGVRCVAHAAGRGRHLPVPRGRRRWRWSTGADRLAVEGINAERPLREDPRSATGAAVGETGAALGATLVGWERDDRDAVILEMKGAWHRWRTTGAPERIHFPFMMSPDTRFMLVVRDVPVEEGGERAPGPRHRATRPGRVDADRGRGSGRARARHAPEGRARATACAGSASTER